PLGVLAVSPDFFTVFLKAPPPSAGVILGEGGAPPRPGGEMAPENVTAAGGWAPNTPPPYVADPAHSHKEGPPHAAQHQSAKDQGPRTKVRRHWSFVHRLRSIVASALRATPHSSKSPAPASAPCRTRRCHTLGRRASCRGTCRAG